MKYRVFLIDDEMWIVRGLLKAIPWSELGYEVVYYSSDSSNIFEKMDSIKPDVIITDIKMPVVTGIDILKYCKDRKEKPEIILLSAYEEFSYAHDALRYGAFSYLVKPIKNTELKEVLIKLKETLDGKKQIVLRDVEQKILENKDDISSEFLFQKAEVDVNEKEFCVLAVAKKFFAENKIISAFSEILPKEKVILRSSQFIYFILNQSSDSIANDKMVEKKMGEYMVYSGLSETFESDGIVYNYLRQAACASLQFLNGLLNNMAQYNHKDRIYKESELYKTLQMAFAKRKGEIIIQQLKILMENRSYNILDFIGIGNYICINIDGKEGFEKYGITTLDQFLDRYQNIDDYFYELQSAVKEAFQDRAAEQLDAVTVKRYIDNHYMENVKVSDIAEHFHVDVGYLGRVFKKNIQKNIKDYIAELKIERAKYLLTFTEMKIYEVSEAVGYLDYFYFTRVFRKMTGETPSEYREKKE